MADDASPRTLPDPRCTWCGHPPHGDSCGQHIRKESPRDAAGKFTYVTGPCPCRHAVS